MGTRAALSRVGSAAASAAAADTVRHDDPRNTDARTPLPHEHAPAAVYAPPRTASASAGSYNVDAGPAGDMQITITGDVTLTPINGDNGRMFMIEVLASGGQRVGAVASSVLLTSGITSRSLTVPSGKVGIFGLRYSALRAAWLLLAATVES